MCDQMSLVRIKSFQSLRNIPVNTSFFYQTVVPGVLLAALLCIGCDRGPRVYMVKGTVTYKGEQVSGATVTFTPKEGSEEAMLAVGTTDPNGNYSLSVVQANKFGKGTTKGEYLVTITKRGGPPITVRIEGILQITDSFLLPMKYAYPDQSGLMATVVAGLNQCDFELAD